MHVVKKNLSWLNQSMILLIARLIRLYLSEQLSTAFLLLRLAYFERKHQFYGIGDLLAEINRHYTSQAVKQMYVVLLGLDVIGKYFFIFELFK